MSIDARRYSYGTFVEEVKERKVDDMAGSDRVGAVSATERDIAMRYVNSSR